MAIIRSRAEHHRYPRAFGPFTVEREIGKGSRSLVYLARDNRDNTAVALKMLHANQEQSLDQQRQNMLQEAQHLRAVAHPNIIALRQHGEIDGVPYMSFPFIQGRGLDQILADKDRLIGPLLESMVKVCIALGHAHKCGVIHRDLKPHNIMITASYEPFVLDWGLSWLKGDKPDPKIQTIVGTPAYMSPEQARGEEHNLTEATDVYSMGSIIYHVLIGKPPFEADTSWKTMQMTMSLPPHPPSKLRTTVDLKLERVVLWCLEKSPDQRYRDGNDLAEDLQRAIEFHAPKGPGGFLNRLFKKRRT